MILTYFLGIFMSLASQATGSSGTPFALPTAPGSHPLVMLTLRNLTIPVLSPLSVAQGLEAICTSLVSPEMGGSGTPFVLPTTPGSHPLVMLTLRKPTIPVLSPIISVVRGLIVICTSSALLGMGSSGTLFAFPATGRPSVLLVAPGSHPLVMLTLRKPMILALTFLLA